LSLLKIIKFLQEKKTVVIALLIILVTITFFAAYFSSGKKMLIPKIENDITSMYTMSKVLQESEMRAAQILDHGSVGWYFIVSGATVEETLQNEEQLINALQKTIATGNLQSVLSTTIFVPPIERQSKVYDAMNVLLPLAAAQFDYLGFPQEYASLFEAEYRAARRFILPQDAPAQAGVSNLWIGELEGNYYSCVFLVKPTGIEVFREIASKLDSVHFINKAEDIGSSLDTLTKTMLFFFVLAYILISAVVFFVYPKREALKICAAPLFIVFFVLIVLTLNNIKLGFFTTIGLILVFGLGLDYIVYMIGRQQADVNAVHKNFTRFATTISFLTTLLSFGALSFSSFFPVHVFGLTVALGLTAAFIFAMLFTVKGVSENQRISGGSASLPSMQVDNM
jgi:predicted exporter